MVGTNIGARRRDRALRAAWVGAAIATALAESIGLAAAAAPEAWLRLFGTDPAMLDAGARYLRAVGPFYGLFGLGMALYFASQGAGRVLWPLLANLTRLAIAAGGGGPGRPGGGDPSPTFPPPRRAPAPLRPPSRSRWPRSPGVEYPRVP